ncbi:hypothetical protein EA58_14785 [Photobacterium galatheae]|uniref:Uncharacterized protein n=1 Tax=Photobacterium galatheae TaxID=1654360 RepID=A0A066RKZ1_9GAMM|nr:hypothetical protein EA58_14785 [Photobacterium galatheae]
MVFMKMIEDKYLFLCEITFSRSDAPGKFCFIIFLTLNSFEPTTLDSAKEKIMEMKTTQAVVR